MTKPWAQPCVTCKSVSTFLIQLNLVSFLELFGNRKIVHKLRWINNYRISYIEYLLLQICKERKACFDMKGRRDPVKIGTDEFGLPKTGEEFSFKIIYKGY